MSLLCLVAPRSSPHLRNGLPATELWGGLTRSLAFAVGIDEVLPGKVPISAISVNAIVGVWVVRFVLVMFDMHPRKRILMIVKPLLGQFVHVNVSVLSLTLCAPLRLRFFVVLGERVAGCAYSGSSGATWGASSRCTRPGAGLRSVT